LSREIGATRPARGSRGGRRAARVRHVVAGLVKMTSDRVPDDVPPHWSVTFAVDDADATAARAEELGGALVAPPMDAGPTRITVVRDPQGAVFTASRFYPERL